MTRSLGALAAACCAWLSLPGCRCGPPEPARGPAAVAAPVADQSAVLATLADDAEREFVFAERGGGVAWVDQRGVSFLAVHDGRAGAAYAAVGPVVLSPDGRRLAHGALLEGRWHVVLDGAPGPPFAEVQTPVFSPDGAHLAYQALAGDRWHLVVDGRVGPGTRAPSPEIQFSADSTRLATIADPDPQGVGRLQVSDLGLASPVEVEARASELAVSPDRTALAAVAERGGKATVLTLTFARPGRVRRGAPYDAAFGLAVGAGGASVAYLAERAGQALVVLDDREAPLPPGQVLGLPVLRGGPGGVGLTLQEGGRARLVQPFAVGEAAGPVVDELAGLTYSADGRSHAYAARRGAHWFAVVDGREGPPFDRVVNPAFSPDGALLVYRARQDGKRFVVVAHGAGQDIRRHPPYQQVFPVHFTRDGQAVAYGVKDGRQLAWKVEPP